MRKLLILSAVLFGILGSCVLAAADLSVAFFGKNIEFDSTPIIENDRTLVQLRPVAEAMGLSIRFDVATNSVLVSDGSTNVQFTVDSTVIYVNGMKRYMGVQMRMKDNYTFIPVRSLAEPFGYAVSFDGVKNKVDIGGGRGYVYENRTPIIEKNNWYLTGSSLAYYCQSDESFGFENNGRGYCWVCSYAMVLSNATGSRITPPDIAKINIDNGYSGNYMSAHTGIVGTFGCRFVPALDESSAYYGGFEAEKRGATMLRIENDADAYNAMREALDRFPCGVIVRFEKYPHSMVAVGYDGNGIYFNDPGIKGGERKRLSETCLNGYKLSDISFIQAIEKKN